MVRRGLPPLPPGFTSAVVAEGERLAAEMAPILAGHPPYVQSVAIAELLSTWIIGHRLANPDAQHRLRLTLMSQHHTLSQHLVAAAEEFGK